MFTISQCGIFLVQVVFKTLMITSKKFIHFIFILEHCVCTTIICSSDLNLQVMGDTPIEYHHRAEYFCTT